MGKPELYARIEERIAFCGEKYEVYKNDAFSSTIWRSRQQMLEGFLSRLEKGQKPKELLAELKQRLPELEKERESEEKSPSFDWYDGHYYYKVYCGQCEACEDMIGILEANIYFS